MDEEGLGLLVLGPLGGAPASAEQLAPGPEAERTGHRRGGGAGDPYRQFGSAGGLCQRGRPVQRHTVCGDFGGRGTRLRQPVGEVGTDRLDREEPGGPVEYGCHDVLRAAVAVLLGPEEAELRQLLAHPRRVRQFGERADVSPSQLRAVQGGQQPQHARRWIVEPVEQQGKQFRHLARQREPGVRGAEPGECRRVEQMQRSALRGLPQGRGGVELVLGEWPLQRADQQFQAGRAVQPGQLHQCAVLGQERGAVGSEGQGGVGDHVGQRQGLFSRQIGIVEVHGHPHPGHQAPQFGGRGRVAHGVVAGFEDLLGEIGHLTVGRVEVDQPVRCGSQPVRRVAQQHAGAAAGRAVELDQPAVPDALIQGRQLRRSAYQFLLPAWKQRDLVPAYGYGALALHQEGYRGAVLGVDQ